mgnify:CR=1 FL=1
MGRVAFGFDTAAVCRLSRLRLDRGGYDAGGAYWGYPNDLYWLRDYDSGGAAVEGFARGADRASAWVQLQRDFPHATLRRRA